MPSYQISSPDGRSFNITVPDGVTQDMVVSRLGQGGFFDPPKDSPVLAGIMDTPVPATVDAARARDNVKEPEDSWLETGKKFFGRIGPLFKQSIGGTLQGLIESGAGAPPNAPLTGFEQEEIRKEAEAALKVARDRKIVPGQRMYESASADLAANEYRPGDSSLKKYVPMVAESVAQMVPAIAAAFATRNPSAAGAVMGAQVGGQQYGESRADGRSVGAAMTDAAFMAASEAIGESIPVGMLMKPGGKFLSRTLKTMGAEGLQEMFTQTLQSGYDMGALSPDMTWGHVRDQLADPTSPYWQGVKDAGIVGAFTGGALSVGVGAVDRGGRIVTNKLAQRRPVAEGVKATAFDEASAVSPDDEASPLPTDLIQKGKQEAAQATGGAQADGILERHGMPKTGTPVTVDMGDGRTQQGVMSDAFDDGDARGLVITLPDGKIMRDHFDDLADAGVTISPRSPTEEADALDAALAQRAARGAEPAPEQTVKAAPDMPPGATRPVSNAKAIVEGLYRDAHVTSWKRNPNDPLSKANPKSWHAKSAAAVDVRPMKGVTFDQFVQRFRDQGYQILEAIDEVKNPSKHATGPHWHLVLGERDAARAPTPAAPEMAEAQQPVADAVSGNLALQSEAAPSLLDDETAPPSTPQETAENGLGGGVESTTPSAPISVRAEDTTDVAVTPTGRQVPVRYAVAELSDLITSNTDDGARNPNYPAELQPRDRSRGVSVAQVHEIASRLNPRLLSRSAKASDGAPIISPEGVVESGNGRTLAIGRAYAANGEQAAAYRAHLAEEGFDISGMNQPVLVRVREGEMAPDDVQAFTREANSRDTLGHSSTEQAMSDAAALPASMLDLYRGGDIDAAGNRDFVRGFMRSIVPSTEHAGMVAADGAMSQQAVARIKGALLARAYGNADLVAKVVESPDSNIKAIGNALTEIAGIYAKLVEATKDGRVDPAMDITANVNEAVAIVDRARRESKTVADLVGQRDIFSGTTVDPNTELVLRIMFARPDFTKPRSQKRMTDALRWYVEQAMLATPGPDLLGTSTKARPDDILKRAKDRDADQTEQPDLLAGRRAEQPAAQSDGGDVAGVRQDGGDRARSTGQGVSENAGDEGSRESVEAAPSLAGEKIDNEWTSFAPDSGTIGIPRADMPQIKAEHRGAMVNFLNARGVDHEEVTVSAADLKPTQAEFSPEKVAKAKAFDGGDRAILISSDGHVADGHHQWLAAREAGEDVRAIRLDAPIRQLVPLMHQFPSSETADGATGSAEQSAPEPDTAPAEDDASFAQVWNSAAFKKVRRALSEPHRESPVAHEMVRGWQDGQAKDIEALHREMDSRIVDTIVSVERPDGFNPVVPYMEGFYAAAMGEARQIRARAVGETLGAGPAMDAIIDKLEGPSQTPATSGRALLDEHGQDTGWLTGPAEDGDTYLWNPTEGIHRRVRGKPDERRLSEIVQEIRDENRLAAEKSARPRTWEDDFNRNPERFLADLDDATLERVGRELNTKRGKTTRTGFIERIAANPISDVRAAVNVAREDGPESSNNAPERRANPPSESASQAARIEDFGETLAGARKHYAQSYRERMEEAGEVDLAAEPLSKSWPEPDYQKLIENGVDPYAVASVRALRDNVPNKPQKGWKLKGWVQTVSALREHANSLLNDVDSSETIVSKALMSDALRRYASDLQGKIDLYLAVGHEKSLKGISLTSGSYSVYNGVRHSPSLVMWTVEKKAKATMASNWPRILAEGRTKQEAIDAFKARFANLVDEPAQRQIKFDIYSRRGQDGFFIGKKIGKETIDLRQFDDVKAARAYLRENHDELVKALEAFKEVPDVRRPSNSPRVGVNHRNGGDVTPAAFAEAFGFRGVQFGNYVEDARRQEDLNEAYDALMDMAGVLGVPARALSLNGQLGLAFGARGKGGKNAAAAHYEPGTIVINLTKTAGKGSLAHEWWHALDNYFARRGGRGDGYMTGSLSDTRHEGVRPEMVEAFKGVMRAIRQTALAQRSQELDKRRTKAYWSTDIEMSARAFESYIIARLADQDFSNDYLANIVDEAAFGIEGAYPYPTAGEIDTIRAGFDHLFDTVQVDGSEGRATLFSRPDGGAAPVATLTGEEIAPLGADIKTLRDRAFAYYKRTYLAKSVTTSDGRKVMFTGRGQRKATSKGETLLRAIPAIRDILERGSLSRSEPGRDPSTKAMHSYVADIEIAGERHHVGVSVRETHEGHFKYDLFLAKDNVGESQSLTTDGARQGRAIQFGITPADGLNLFIVDEERNPNSGQAAKAALDDLHARLREVGIADRIAGEVVATIRGDRAIAGSFSPRDFQIDGRMFKGLIRVAQEVAQDQTFTANHEIIHALRSLGLFLPVEWAALERRVRGDKALMASVKRRYRTLDEAFLVEEAVADLFGGWVVNRSEQGFIARAFDRVLSFLSALSSWAQGNGFVSAEGVMRAIDEGRMGLRAQSKRARRNWPAAVSVEDVAKYSRLDTTRTALTSFAGKGATFSGQAAALFDRWRTAVQDRYLPLLRTQQAIEAQLGEPLGESVNPYLGEELMTGRIGTKLERLSDEMVAPLLDDMHAAGVEIDELETYLYARHAPERNAQIAKINPAFQPGEGSGMTDIEARAIIKRIERGGKLETMERLAAQVDAIIDWSLQERIDAGLMSEDEAKSWRETYQNYVPLRGNVELEGADASIRINRGGSGLSVRGRESRRAFGRKSQAENILSYVVMQAEEAVVRGETNRVAQSFVRLAERAPDSDFWSVDKVTRKPVADPTTGLVRYEDQTRLQPEDANFTVSAKFDGEERRVTMNRANPAAMRLADSMRNLTQQQLDWVTQHLGKLNRFLSAVNTSWNPEFVITNAFRDLQTAAINLTGEQQQGIVSGTLRDYRKALVAATKGEFGKGTGEWHRWYQEFRAEGGRIAFNQIEDIPGIKKRLRDSFAMAAARDKPGANLITAKRAFFALRDTIGALNGGVENAIRLSAYKNAREGGMSKAQAASLAKNLTVNFNRRGQMGPAINAAYLFFNASMQGSARIILAMKSPRVRKVLAGVAVAGFLVEMLNSMLSADDDDGEAIYDKISDFDKSRNFILMMPNGRDYVKVPMPYGYNVFANSGRTLAEIMRRGGDRWQESAGNFISSVVDAFNPVGGSESLLNFLAPTAFDPVVDLTQNKDFAGRPIQPEENPFAPPKPDHLNYFSSVAPHWKAVTDTLASMTGGDDVVPGAIDISPETLEYLSGTVFGAAGAFVDRLAGLGGKVFDSEAEITANDLPLARKVIGQKPSWYDKSAYYERVKQIDQAIDYAKGYLEREDYGGFEAYRDSQTKLLSLEPAKKEAESEMRKIRKARREIDFAHELGKVSDDQWSADRQRIKDAETTLVTAFNRRWNETMASRAAE